MQSVRGISVKAVLLHVDGDVTENLRIFHDQVHGVRMDAKDMLEIANVKLELLDFTEPVQPPSTVI